MHDRLSLEATIIYVLEDSLRKIARMNGLVGAEVDEWIGSTDITTVLKKIRPDPEKATKEAVAYMIELLLPQVSTEEYQAQLQELVSGERVALKQKPLNQGSHGGYADRSHQILKTMTWR